MIKFAIEMISEGGALSSSESPTSLERKGPSTQIHATI